MAVTFTNIIMNSQVTSANRITNEDYKIEEKI